VVESNPPKRLVTTWSDPNGEPDDQPSRVTFDIQRYHDVVKLTVTHEDLADEADRRDAAGGWAAVLSNLKSLLETGHPLPVPPWEVDRAAR
jgi:uncharacterized protein YndB with AHSA1/START domain